jgi:hypothetical protein
MDVVPEGMDVVPEGMDVVPEGMDVVPEGMDIVPEGMDIVPEGMDIVPEGMDIVPEGMDVVPEGSSGFLVNLYKGLTPKGSLAMYILLTVLKSYNTNAKTPSSICNVCSIPNFSYKCKMISQSELVLGLMFSW